MTPEAALAWMQQHGYECIGLMFASRAEARTGLVWLDRNFPEEARRDMLQKELDGDVIEKIPLRAE